MFIALIFARGAIVRLFLAFITHAYAPHKRPLIAHSFATFLFFLFSFYIPIFSTFISSSSRPSLRICSEHSKSRFEMEGRRKTSNHLYLITPFVTSFIARDPSSNSIIHRYAIIVNYIANIFINIICCKNKKKTAFSEKLFIPVIILKITGSLQLQIALCTSDLKF